MEKRMEKTDYKITEFHNSEFGSIRMIEDGGRLFFWNGCSICFGICKTKKCDKCSLQGGPETGRPYIRWGTANDFYSRGRCISADYKKSFKVSTEF